MKDLYARKSDVNGSIKYQTLESHIFGVRDRINNYSKMTLLNNIAEFIALVHDAGKFNILWQDYLIDEKNRNGKMQHSLTG